MLKWTRRSSAAGVARGLGVSPLALWAARLNRSMSVRTTSPSGIAGGLASASGWNDQWVLPAWTSMAWVATALPSRGSGAPSWIHFSKSATIDAGSLAFGGIIGMVGCYKGMRCGASSAAVGRAVTSAVVTSITLVVVADALFEVTFSFLGWR